MKRSIIIFISFIVILNACSNSKETNEKVSINLSDEGLYQLGEQYLNPAFHAGMTNEPWESPTRLEADKFLIFYIWASQQKSFDFSLPDDLDENGDGDIYIPADVVESEIWRFFDVDADYIRSSEDYNEEMNSYLLFGLGGASSCEVDNVFVEDNRVIIEFSGYQDGVLYQTGKLLLEAKEDAYRYISCEVSQNSELEKSRSEGELVRTDLNLIHDKYVDPLRWTTVIGQPWSDPSGIDPDSVLSIYMRKLYDQNESEPYYIDYEYVFPADIVEAYTFEFFGMTAEQTRESSRFDAETQRYIVPEGIGGAWDVRTTGAVESGDILRIQYEVIDGQGQVSHEGELTVSLEDDDRHQYISNSLS